MPRKNHLIVDSGCTQDNERWALSACGLNEDSATEWDGTHQRDFVSCKRCLAKIAKPRPAPEPFHKERPILFNGAMVRAILSGQKTVTRRLVKGNQIPSRSKSDFPEHQWIAVVQDHPRWGFAAFGATEEECAAELAMYGGCPYGRQGDRLWVRETWYCDHDEVMRGPYLKPDDLDGRMPTSSPWQLKRPRIRTTIALAASARARRKEQRRGPKSNHRPPANAERHLEDRQKVQRRTNSREYWHL
ncbi:hypothetical protein [Pseudomonas koreensis]|uniref:hypothetical protein n=1 Tax=Pseudomonas koreensis TaxID=198620 RepID=UPI00320A85AA